MKTSCRDDGGTALIWALLFVIITSGLVVSHTTFLASRRSERDARYTRATMADTFARSGLQDAVGWFHRRSNQPITTFDPVNEPDSNPPRVETIDPALGLVREFRINGSLWGRYEVRHEDARDISSQRGELTPGSVWELGVRAYVYRNRDPEQPFDASPNQLIGTTALKSEIRWLRVNPPVPAALCVDDPGSIEVGPNTTIDGGPSIGIGYRDPAATDGATPSEPVIDPAALVTGVPAKLATPAYDADAMRVFSMRLDELRCYTDVLIPASMTFEEWKEARDAEKLDWLEDKSAEREAWQAQKDAEAAAWSEQYDAEKAAMNDAPQAEKDAWEAEKQAEKDAWLAQKKVEAEAWRAEKQAEKDAWIAEGQRQIATGFDSSEIEAQLIYTEDLKLAGELRTNHTLLLVDGDLTDDGYHDTVLNGVVYVTGDVKIDSGKLNVQGVMIVRGKAELGGSSEIQMTYDPQILENVRRMVGKYRKRRGSDPSNP